MGALRLDLASRIPGSRLASGVVRGGSDGGYRVELRLAASVGVGVDSGRRRCRRTACLRVAAGWFIDWWPARRLFGESIPVGSYRGGGGERFGSCASTRVMRQCGRLGPVCCRSPFSSAAVGGREGPRGYFGASFPQVFPRRGLVRRWGSIDGQL